MTSHDEENHSAKPKATSGNDPAGQNTLWGGRFGAGPSELMARINASIGFDKRLADQDIEASRAHCRMLVAQDIITRADGAAILEGLDQVAQEIHAGDMVWDDRLEDIHMHVEARLKEIIGDAAGRLHTARSRNDQVATDFRLWVRDEIDGADAALVALQRALLDQAERHADTIMPGFTHLQTAQPVTLGHHLMAYVEMVSRDRSRLRDGRKRLNHNPLGSAALAGTSFPIDREATSRALGFDAPTRNSLDAVSDRDFALEFLSTLTICAMHMSRLADEIVLWATPQFRFITLSDDFSTGSSIMPQKRNPDAAELVRAKVGRIAGAFQGLVMVLKGLPLAYSKDMQEDKEPVFDASDAFALCVRAMTGMIADLRPNKDAMHAAASRGFSTATDLADWLVRVADMPFRKAHHVTGQLVRLAEQKGCDLPDLSLADMQSVEPMITKDIFSVLSVEASVASRRSFGGTAPDQVRAAISTARANLESPDA